MLIRRDEHNIDRVFRQKLHDAQESPPTHLWEGIRSNASSRKRFLGWWFALGALLILSIGFGSYTLLATKDLKAENATVSIPNHASEQQLAKDAIASASVIKEDALSENKTNNSNNNLIEEQVNTPVQQSVTITPAANAPIKKTKNNIASPATKKAIQPIAPIERSSTAHTTTVITLPSADVLTEQDTQSTDDLAIATTPANDAQNILYGEELTETSPFTIEPTDSLVAISNASDSANSPIIYQLPNITKAKHFAIGVYGTYLQPQRHFAQEPSSSQTNAYVQPSQMKMHHGYATGMALTYQFQKHIYGVGAIEYMSFKEEMKYSRAQEYANYSYYNLTDSVQVIENGDTTLVGITIPVVYDTNYTYQGHNRKQVNTYSTLQIPLLLGANQSVNKWTFGIEAGPVLHIAKWYRGDLRTNDLIVASADTSSQSLNVSEQKINGTQISTSAYYKNWNLDLHTGLRIGYNITDKWQIALGGQYRWMMRRTQDQVLSRHRMALPGVSFGLYYQF